MTADEIEGNQPQPGEPDPKLAPRYAEIATFLRAPLVRELNSLDIAMVGVPYDGGVTNRPGARHGPREIRNQSSLMRSIHPEYRIDPHSLCRVGDVGDVPLVSVFDHRSVAEEIEAFFGRLVEHTCVPLTAGGDHSISYPILKAVGRNRPVGLIQIDSHTDTWDEFLGSDLHHGSPFRRATEDGVLDPKRTVQVAIRGAQNTREGWEYSEHMGMRVLFMHEVTRLGIEATIEEIRRVVGDGPTYVSFDIDALDPAFAPGTGTPEIGGLTTVEALTLLRGLRGLDLVGADIVEVAPPLDPSGNTALVGATLMYELLCLLADANAG